MDLSKKDQSSQQLINISHFMNNLKKIQTLPGGSYRSMSWIQYRSNLIAHNGHILDISHK